MDAKMRDLFDRMKPYVEQNDYFDLVETKFGLLQIFTPEEGENYYHRIRDYKHLLHTLIFELSADVREESGLEHLHVDLHPSEAEETARRALPHLVNPGDVEELKAFLQESMRL